MNGWRTAGCVLTLALLCGALGSGAESPGIESARLKSKGLEELTAGSGVALAGFSWRGAARRFGVGVTLADVATPETGDVSFSVLGKGKASVCEELLRLGSREKGLKKARLTFRDDAGTGTSFRLQGLSVEAADCGATPWTADLAAQTVRADGGEKDGKAKKGKGEAVRMEVEKGAG